MWLNRTAWPGLAGLLCVRHSFPYQQSGRAVTSAGSSLCVPRHICRAEGQSSVVNTKQEKTQGGRGRHAAHADTQQHTGLVSPPDMRTTAQPKLCANTRHSNARPPQVLSLLQAQRSLPHHQSLLQLQRARESWP